MSKTLIHFYRNDYSSLSEAQENGGVYTAHISEESIDDSKHAAEVALYAAGLDDRIIIVVEHDGDQLEMCGCGATTTGHCMGCEGEAPL